jgi:hypothetical protein
MSRATTSTPRRCRSRRRRPRRLQPGRTLLRRHWILVLGVLSLLGLVAAINPAKLGRVLDQVSVVPLVLTLPCPVGMNAVRALGWRVALRRTGVDIGVIVMIAGRARPRCSPVAAAPLAVSGRSRCAR